MEFMVVMDLDYMVLHYTLQFMDLDYMDADSMMDPIVADFTLVTCYDKSIFLWRLQMLPH